MATTTDSWEDEDPDREGVHRFAVTPKRPTSPATTAEPDDPLPPPDDAPPRGRRDQAEDAGGDDEGRSSKLGVVALAALVIGGGTWAWSVLPAWALVTGLAGVTGTAVVARSVARRVSRRGDPDREPGRGRHSRRRDTGTGTGRGRPGTRGGSPTGRGGTRGAGRGGTGRPGRGAAGKTGTGRGRTPATARTGRPNLRSAGLGSLGRRPRGAVRSLGLPTTGRSRGRGGAKSPLSTRGLVPGAGRRGLPGRGKVGRFQPPAAVAKNTGGRRDRKDDRKRAKVDRKKARAREFPTLAAAPRTAVGRRRWANRLSDAGRANALADIGTVDGLTRRRRRRLARSVIAAEQRATRTGGPTRTFLRGLDRTVTMVGAIGALYTVRIVRAVAWRATRRPRRWMYRHLRVGWQHVARESARQARRHGTAWRGRTRTLLFTLLAAGVRYSAAWRTWRSDRAAHGAPAWSYTWGDPIRTTNPDAPYQPVAGVTGSPPVSIPALGAAPAGLGSAGPDSDGYAPVTCVVCGEPLPADGDGGTCINATCPSQADEFDTEVDTDRPGYRIAPPTGGATTTTEEEVPMASALDVANRFKITDRDLGYGPHPIMEGLIQTHGLLFAPNMVPQSVPAMVDHMEALASMYAGDWTDDLAGMAGRLLGDQFPVHTLVGDIFGQLARNCQGIADAARQANLAYQTANAHYMQINYHPRPNEGWNDVPTGVEQGVDLTTPREWVRGAHAEVYGYNPQNPPDLRMFLRGMLSLYAQLGAHAEQYAQVQFPGAGAPLAEFWSSLGATYLDLGLRSVPCARTYEETGYHELDRWDNPQVNEHLANASRARL